MAQDKVTAAAGGHVLRGGPGPTGTGQVSIILAGAIRGGGVLAEIVAPGPVTLLTGADFAVGACYAVVGAWLLRARGRGRDSGESGTERPARSPADGWLALAVSAAWFLGTALSALPAALSSYGAGVAVLGYRAMLAHLLLRSVTQQRRPGRRAGVSARLLIALCYAAVLLPVPADGLVTAGLMAVLTVLTALAVRRVAADRRPVLLTVSLAAATLAAVWWHARRSRAGSPVCHTGPGLGRRARTGRRATARSGSRKRPGNPRASARRG